jgi:hypothetical protein
MFDRSLTIVALVLFSLGGATGLAAQGPTQKPAAKPAPPPAQTSPYVPAIMQPRMVTLNGCLQQKEGYILTQATVPAASAKEKEEPAPSSSYTLEGLSSARLSLLVGKRVTVTGAYLDAPATGAAATKAGVRFEATNVTEAEGACNAG